MSNTLTPETIRRPRKPFRDTSYCTWLDGKRLYSPARLFRDLGLKPDFSDIDPSVLLRAAQRGKLVEVYCYELLQGRPVTVRARHCGSLLPTVSQRVEAFWRWQEKTKPEYVDHQSMVWNEQDRIAWTRDFRAIINGKLTLVDIKCTSQPALDWPLQLGCGLTYDEDGCDRAAILHLNPTMNKNGFKFRDAWTAEQLKRWWRITVDHWRSRYEFNHVKGELGFESEAMGLETEDDPGLD